jgi:hypothetical protein
MDKIEIESSTIKSIGYDDALNFLEVSYKKGTTYRFYDVPQDLFEDLMESKSKGKFLRENIEKKFETEKV